MTTLYDYEKQSSQRTGYSESTTPSERFLAGRDIALVSILTLHLGNAILAIPTIVTHQASISLIKYLVVVIVLGVLAPLFATLSFRDHISIGKFTCALWWELTWTFCIFFIDLVLTICYGTAQGGSKTIIGLTATQTLIVFFYFAALTLMTQLHTRRYPGISFWSNSVQSISWLRSPVIVSPTSPMAGNLSVIRPFYVAPAPKQQAPAPWDVQYEEELEKIRQDPYKEIRLVEAETNMLYKMERYGLRPPYKHHSRKVSNKPVTKADISRPLIDGEEPDSSRTRPSKPVAKADISRPLIKPDEQENDKPPKLTIVNVSKPLPVVPRRSNTLPTRYQQSSRPLHVDFPTPTLSPIGFPARRSRSDGQRTRELTTARRAAAVLVPAPVPRTIMDSPRSVYPEDSPAFGLSRTLTLPAVPTVPKRMRTKRNWDTNQ